MKSRSPLLIVMLVVLLPAVRAQLTKLADMSPTLGTSPSGPVLEMGGNYYFTCSAGGLTNGGTIVVHVPGTGTFKLVDLYGPVTGGTPKGGLLPLGNHLYFTCSDGGANGFGTLSDYDLTTGTVTVLVHLTAGTGQNPEGSVTNVAGSLYFTCPNGGSSGVWGAVQKYDLASASLNTYSITSTLLGTAPRGSMGAVGANLYFTCSAGTVCNGTLCKFNTTTGALAKVADVCPADTPRGDVLAIGTDLFFTASAGSSNSGALFKYSTTAPMLSTLTYLNNPTGAYPYGGFAYDGGLFYFTTHGGAASGQGGLSIYNGISQSIAVGDPSMGYAPGATPLISGSHVIFTCTNGGANAVGTLVSMPQVAHAQGITVGQGCGSGFTPSLSVSVVPTLGQILTITLSGAPPLTPGAYVYSGIPAGSVQVSTGCNVYVDLATFAELGTLFTTPFGAHSLTYPLPAAPSLSGVTGRVQAYLVTPSGPGYALSNGLELTLGY